MSNGVDPDEVGKTLNLSSAYTELQIRQAFEDNSVIIFHKMVIIRDYYFLPMRLSMFYF